MLLLSPSLYLVSRSEKGKEDSKKAAKVKKAEINIEDISDKVNELRKIVSEVGKVKDLKDEEIREKLLDTKRWETKLDNLKDSRTKLKIELVTVDI